MKNVLRWFRKGRWVRIFTVYFPAVMFLVVTLFPFYWMSISSFKPQSELYQMGKPLVVSNPTIEAYVKLFSDTMFLTWFKNSLWVAGVSTLIAVIVGALGGYAIARFRFTGRKLIGQGVLLTYLVPRTLLFIPLYDIFFRLNWLDSNWALIVSTLTFVVPFVTWLLIGYFQSIPIEIEQCARIDGASHLQVLRYVVLPLSAPGLVSGGLFAFTQAWNIFIYPLVFISSPDQKTIPVGLSMMQMGDVFLWGQLMAAGVLASLPLVIFYTFFQRYMVEGLTAGAVKG